MIPKDPVILLSYVNTQLRDYYESPGGIVHLQGDQEKGSDQPAGSD